MENRDPNSNGNGNVGNLAAMKRIMQQMRTMAQTPGGMTPDHDSNGRGGSFAENRDPNSNGNGNVSNLAAMKRIMWQKHAMAQDARKEMGPSSLL